MSQTHAPCKDASRGIHNASHPEWAYREEALVYISGVPRRPNIIPFASEMSRWLARKSAGLPVVKKDEVDLAGAYTNPYTYSLATISSVLSAVINDAAHFSDAQDKQSPVHAEMARIRLETELVIYAARFCEASIKQMLYCTQIPNNLYGKASMGQLLARDCDLCKKAGSTPHDISLLGSLAHRFFLCGPLDQCVVDHLQLVARRRNLEAAHSDAQWLDPQGGEVSRKNLRAALDSIGQDLGHMAEHIGDIELRMIEELQMNIANYPVPPSRGNLAKIPVRWLNQYPDKESDEAGGK